ncbi:MAG TPA: S41 family peptidase [Acidobacteriaceae bacterium]|nr:S41 family peptidase [Acidobacteriaceae bacterium]
MVPDHGLSSGSIQQVRRRLFKRRAVGWSAAILSALILLFLLVFWRMREVIAHRLSFVLLTVTSAEIEAENTRLKQAGLIVKDGNFFKEHPFDPPWTSHSLLIPSSWNYQPVFTGLIRRSHRVRADLLLEDLDVLQPVMERAYGGWGSAAARGWSWDKWFADWRKLLAAKGTAEIPFREAFAPVDALKAFQRDNHTQIPLERGADASSDGSQTALLASTPTAPCTEARAGGRLIAISTNDASQHVRAAKKWSAGAAVFENEYYISMPRSFGSPQSVLCGKVWIPLRRINEREGGLWSRVVWRLVRKFRHDRPRVERLGDGIVYMHLPTFIWSNYEGVLEKDWPVRKSGDRVLIVDLRGNGGGSESYGLKVLKGWIDEKRMVPFGDLGVELNSSCLYAALRWNQAVESTPISFPGQKKFLQSLLDRMAQPYPSGCPRSVEIQPAKWTYMQRRFAPKPDDLRIIALVDSYCGSDCELMVMRLASLPDTVVAGTNTFGVGQFVQPGYSVLPHTGLRYRIALGRSNFYGDNRSFDGYGLDVDVVLPEVDSLGLRQLRELAEAVKKMQ